MSIAPFDEYVDQVSVNSNAFGISLNFRKTNPQPVMPGTAAIAFEIGTIRMSLEHFKTMIFMLKRQVNEIEGQLGITIPLPIQAMNNMKIAPEDWEAFWKRV